YCQLLLCRLQRQNSFLERYYVWLIHSSFHTPHSELVSAPHFPISNSTFLIPHPSTFPADSFLISHFAFRIPQYLTISRAKMRFDPVIQIAVYCRTGGAPWLLFKYPPDWPPTS